MKEHITYFHRTRMLQHIVFLHTHSLQVTWDALGPAPVMKYGNGGRRWVGALSNGRGFSNWNILHKWLWGSVAIGPIEQK